MERKNCQRTVEFAVGFLHGQWIEVEIIVEEDPDRALDDEEVVEAATKIIQQATFEHPVSFYHVLYISPPEGGYADDSY